MSKANIAIEVVRATVLFGLVVYSITTKEFQAAQTIFLFCIALGWGKRD